jgi:hypothetical protein
MSTKGLSLKEIVGIIEACGKNQVSELKFGDLQITFHQSAQSHEASQIPNQNYEVSGENILSRMSDSDSEDEETRILEQEALRQAQELLTDPESHELDMIEQAVKE